MMMINPMTKHLKKLCLFFGLRLWLTTSVSPTSLARHYLRSLNSLIFKVQIIFNLTMTLSCVYLQPGAASECFKHWIIITEIFLLFWLRFDLARNVLNQKSFKSLPEAKQVVWNTNRHKTRMYLYIKLRDKSLILHGICKIKVLIKGLFFR